MKSLPGRLPPSKDVFFVPLWTPLPKSTGYELAFKLANLVSIKGEDIMINTSTSQQSKFHRLRATVLQLDVGDGASCPVGSGHVARNTLTHMRCEPFWRRYDGGLSISSTWMFGCFISQTVWFVCTRWAEVAAALASWGASSHALTPRRWPEAFIPSGGTCAPSKTLLIAQAGGRAGSKPSSAMPRAKVVEGKSASDRARQRRALGTLRELTVQPATKRRYGKALDAFFVFLKANNLVLPTSKQHLDPLVCDYIEYMWSTGVGRGQANDTVAALQDHQPNLRGHFPGAWRLLKTWSVNEIPNRAPPLPEAVVQAMAGWAFFHGHFSFGVSLVIGFYTMLRSGELLGLEGQHIMCSHTERQALISLGYTEGGKRQGAAESVILGVDAAVRLTRHWKSLSTLVTPLVLSPVKWRAMFNESLSALVGLICFSPI